MIYFWSDTHFNHGRIIELCYRDFKTVEEMNESMIKRWNDKVSAKDEIYHLGDFGFSHSKLPALGEIFAQLNGTKHLIIGNHDERNPAVLKLPWASKQDLLTVRQNGKRIIACHYPMESWKGMFKNYVHLHGHCHGQLRRKLARRIDVGVDCFSRPVEYDAIFEAALKLPYESTDGHKGEKI